MLLTYLWENVAEVSIIYNAQINGFVNVTTYHTSVHYWITCTFSKGRCYNSI